MLLIDCDLSSLVIDTLCKQAVGENATVACFYFDFPNQYDLLASIVGYGSRDFLCKVEECIYRERAYN